MRRLYSILIIVLILSLFCSCGISSLPSAETASPSNSPTVSPAPSPSPSSDNTQREEIFRTFLSKNYQELTDSFSGGISGIGFIDLDLDGGMEMIIFDSGASAAMGVHLFDIVSGKVECISANLDAVRKTFGGSNMSDVIVNANHFNDFRLMKDKSTGEEFFVVNSGNGAADFSYSELIRFGSKNGVLTLESLLYKYETTDVDTGTVTGDSYKIKGKAADGSAYKSAQDTFYKNTEDSGFDAKGILTLESDSASSKEGLMAMADKALSLYESDIIS